MLYCRDDWQMKSTRERKQVTQTWSTRCRRKNRHEKDRQSVAFVEQDPRCMHGECSCPMKRSQHSQARQPPAICCRQDRLQGNSVPDDFGSREIRFDRKKMDPLCAACRCRQTRARSVHLASEISARSDLAGGVELRSGLAGSDNFERWPCCRLQRLDRSHAPGAEHGQTADGKSSGHVFDRRVIPRRRSKTRQLVEWCWSMLLQIRRAPANQKSQVESEIFEKLKNIWSKAGRVAGFANVIAYTVYFPFPFILLVPSSQTPTTSTLDHSPTTRCLAS